MKLVSVIVPCRNERGFIEAFCDSLFAQVLPPGWRLQAVLADGQSDDGTAEWLQARAAQDERLRVIDNPGRIVSTGLNRALTLAEGEFIVRMDVHTVYAPDYVAACIATWQRTGADNVGGPWKASGDGPMQRAICAVFQSRWISGGARSRLLDYEGEVDTVYLGAWPRASFERFGGFDEGLVRNQDDEHNLRIHKGGGRIWQSSSIHSTYFPRASKMDVFRQYRQYGYWKPFVMLKHGQAAALRHLIPGLFVAALILLLLVTLIGVPTLMWAPLSPSLQDLLTVVVAVASGLALLQGWLYGTAVFWISWRIAREQGRDLRWQLPDVIAAYHFGYGLGSIRGWWDALVRRRPDPAFGRLTR